jgi:hypothetical protein
VAVWLPQLLESRGEATVRVAPISHGEELYGLVVAERAIDGPAFDERVENVLSELARQVGLALRNVRLDSRLQASLDELREQAVELRASRARVVAAADAERRRIERDLHDGAQQYFAGVTVNLQAARGLIDADPEQAKSILDELHSSTQDALEGFRDLSHGIYPRCFRTAGSPRRSRTPPAARRFLLASRRLRCLVSILRSKRLSTSAVLRRSRMLESTRVRERARQCAFGSARAAFCSKLPTTAPGFPHDPAPAAPASQICETD